MCWTGISAKIVHTQMSTRALSEETWWKNQSPHQLLSAVECNCQFYSHSQMKSAFLTLMHNNQEASVDEWNWIELDETTTTTGVVLQPESDANRCPCVQICWSQSSGRAQVLMRPTIATEGLNGCCCHWPETQEMALNWRVKRQSANALFSLLFIPVIPNSFD